VEILTCYADFSYGEPSAICASDGVTDMTRDSRQFLIEQFKNANTLWPLSRADREQSDEVTDHIKFSEYVYREKTVAQKANQVMKSTALLGLTQFDKCKVPSQY
jgi:hypothetical protein